jgi:hypothetical protein
MKSFLNFPSHLHVFPVTTGKASSWSGFVFLLLLMSVGMAAQAQDKIVRKDGQVIQVKILSKDDTYVRYKRFDNLSGPEYFLFMYDVKELLYEKVSGNKVEFEQLIVLEQKAKRYQQNSLAYNLVGAGVLVAGVGTFVSILGSYSTYKSQLDQTNQEFRSWYLNNYGGNATPGADNFVEPKGLFAAGSPGVYLAAAGFAGGAVLIMQGVKNAKLKRKTLQEVQTLKKQNQLSMSPFYSPVGQIGGLSVLVKF